MTFSIATVNLNGIRAAAQKGFPEWLARQNPDIVLMQEVRAPEDIAAGLMGEEWHTVTVPCRIKGRAGVAISARRGAATIDEASVRTFLDEEESDVDSGRWVEAVVSVGGSQVKVVSAYFHSGEKDTPKQEAKMAHLPRIGARMRELLAEAAAGGPQVVVAGDFNVVRSEKDIKNWKPNHNKRAGVLDEEIAFLDQWVDEGWHDVMRDLAGDVQGPYTWWSWRGQAFDNDAGWRIDYQYATPVLAEYAGDFTIERAPAYDQRFSDHAALTIHYNA